MSRTRRVNDKQEQVFDVMNSLGLFEEGETVGEQQMDLESSFSDSASPPDVRAVRSAFRSTWIPISSPSSDFGSLLSWEKVLFLC